MISDFDRYRQIALHRSYINLYSSQHEYHFFHKLWLMKYIIELFYFANMIGPNSISLLFKFIILLP